jgi:nodulation protein E
MRAALSDAGLSTGDIDYVNAHGTGTRMNDKTETKAIRAVFGEHADSLAVSSTKSLHGHAMGASGAIEAAITIVAGNAGLIPPTANLRVPDPECDLDYVPGASRSGALHLALSNSLAFGGMNVVLAMRTAGGIAEEVRA